VTERGDQPAHERLFQLASGYRLTQALYVAAKLEIADRLVGGPRDADSLAREVGAHPDRLFRVLRALASFGVFTLDAERRFSLTPVGECLRSDAPGSLAAFSTFQGEEPYRAFGELLHTVRTGETAFDHIYGMGHFDYLAQHPDASATFHRAMAGALGVLDDPLEGCDLHDRHVVVDIGGGRGALLAAVLRRYPALKGILFDLPNAVTDAPAFLDSCGVKNRCEVRTGSAFDSVPSGGDVYVMSRILHDWSDEKASQLLRNCRKAIPDEGVLLLREGVLGEGAPPPARAQLDLIMMAVTGGRERTEAEWRELLRRAGFSLQTVLPGPRSQELILAHPVVPPARR
jgi:O-methyltransferase domain/Dimerisation domain